MDMHLLSVSYRQLGLHEHVRPDCFASLAPMFMKN